MNAFLLFSGFALGTLFFELLLNHGFNTALAVFAAAQFCFGLLAVIAPIVKVRARSYIRARSR